MEQLFGSPLSQLKYDKSVPVTLDTNFPSNAASVPSIYTKLKALSGNKNSGW